LSQSFGQSWGRGQASENFLSSSLIAMQTLVAECHTVLAHVGGLPYFGGAGDPLPRDMDRA